jgi:hypothetical protein
MGISRTFLPSRSNSGKNFQRLRGPFQAPANWEKAHRFKRTGPVESDNCLQEPVHLFEVAGQAGRISFFGDLPHTPHQKLPEAQHLFDNPEDRLHL